ncbi:hypothetical protein BGY98DRAFT_1006080 [Russula aff. rugulosa BPL654]|nr:hypothetical protein BGY98DRAFT_1006080 [Russula aff. rugulosa BPL654]
MVLVFGHTSSKRLKAVLWNLYAQNVDSWLFVVRAFVVESSRTRCYTLSSDISSGRERPCTRSCVIIINGPPLALVAIVISS